MFRHHKVPEHKTGELNRRVEPESSVETKPGDKVGEQFGGGRGADHRRQEDEGGARPSHLGWEDLTDDDLHNREKVKSITQRIGGHFLSYSDGNVKNII